jgi:hypothetical protein
MHERAATLDRFAGLVSKRQSHLLLTQGAREARVLARPRGTSRGGPFG